MTEKTELKPCPCCEGLVKPHNPARLVGVAAKCQNCKMVFVGFWSDSEVSFAEKFNTRPAPAVSVKPLEWFLGSHRSNDGHHEAQTMLGTYSCREVGALRKYWTLWKSERILTEDEYEDVEQAKAAAQADYERRILSALSPQPQVTKEQTTTVRPEAVDALASYEQADMDGIMVLVSRQAIEECLPALRAIAGGDADG